MKFRRTFLLGLCATSYTKRLNTVVDASNLNLKKSSSIKTKNLNGLARGPTIDKILLGRRGS